MTVSTDSPETIADERHLHGLNARMLSDVDLSVTDAFGLRNTGVHAAPPSHESVALPVPATLLVDAEGRVLWLDLSENYQQRSDPAVVLAAMEAHFDTL